MATDSMYKFDEKTSLFLSGLPFFKGLERQEVSRLLEKSDINEYSKGQSLFMAGDKATRFFVIINGWAKIFRMTKEGEEAVLAIFTRGDVFGEAAIFENADYPFSVEIAETARLLEIPSTSLRESAARNPDITGRIMASMSREMQKLQIENEHLSIMTAPQRVGCLLIQLSSGMIGKGGVFSFPYDKSLAAARLGMKPETFSRALSQLKPYGINVRGGEIEIESFERIMMYVCGHCSMQDGDCRGAKQLTECSLKNCANCKTH